MSSTTGLPTRSETSLPAPLPGDPLPEARPRLQSRARLALVVVLIALGLWTVRGFIPAIAWASILAVAIWPTYSRLKARWSPGRPGILLPLLFTLAAAVLFGLPFVVLAIQAGREARDLVELFRQAETGGLPVPEALSHLPYGAELAAWWRDTLSGPLPVADLVQHIDRGSALTLTRQIGLAAAHRTVLFFFTLMTFFFLLRDGEGLVRDLLQGSANLFGARGERIMRQMVSSIHGTVDGLVLVGLGEGILMGIIYHVVGLPHPTLFGAATAVAAMIPFAVFVVFTLVGLILLAQGAVAAAIAVVAIGTVVVLVADHFIRPVLIGGATRLPFLWVLFGILGGVETFGIVGLFVGPALMAALILLWREFVEASRAGHVGGAARPEP